MDLYEELAAAESAQDRNGCWPWQRGRTRNGYGQITIAGRRYYAHRAVYSEVVGPLTDDQHVLHNCDNPACVNPDHLRTGSHLDNMRDKALRGRHGMQKISFDAVCELRAWHTVGGWTQQDLAEAFGIDQTQVSNIVLGKQRRFG